MRVDNSFYSVELMGQGAMVSGDLEVLQKMW